MNIPSLGIVRQKKKKDHIDRFENLRHIIGGVIFSRNWDNRGKKRNEPATRL